MSTREYHLILWCSEYFLVQYGRSLEGPYGVSAGNRPSASRMEFCNNPRGPYARPEDLHLPDNKRRYDYYVDFYTRRLTRQIASESTFYTAVRYRGIVADISGWCDPAPHGHRLNMVILPGHLRDFAEGRTLTMRHSDTKHSPFPEFNAPTLSWEGLEKVLRREGWDITDDYSMGTGAHKACMIDELELIEGSWPKEVLEALEE